MKTLILKTEGISSYGLQTFDIHRRVNHFPTRSAILGMLGAALGITREQYSDLFILSDNIKIAVQVNKCGKKITDFHTVQNFRSPQGKIQKNTKLTYRDYWCDSKHLFAITAEKGLIDKLETKVKKPEFCIYQGRKSCPLTRPLFEVVLDNDNPANALKQYGDQGQIFSDVSGDNQFAILQVRDLNTSKYRKYAVRDVYVCGVSTGNEYFEEQNNEFT